MKAPSTPAQEFAQVITDYQWECERGDPSNKEMLAMFASDRKAMRQVLMHYVKGDMAKAHELARHMDTAARDYIPQRIWDDITK